MISSFEDPLGMMLEQLDWAARNWIERVGTLDGVKFRYIYEHLENEINEYLKKIRAPAKRPLNSTVGVITL